MFLQATDRRRFLTSTTPWGRWTATRWSTSRASRGGTRTSRATSPRSSLRPSSSPHRCPRCRSRNRYVKTRLEGSKKGPVRQVKLKAQNLINKVKNTKKSCLPFQYLNRDQAKLILCIVKIMCEISITYCFGNILDLPIPTYKRVLIRKC